MFHLKCKLQYSRFVCLVRIADFLVEDSIEKSGNLGLSKSTTCKIYQNLNLAFLRFKGKFQIKTRYPQWTQRSTLYIVVFKCARKRHRNTPYVRWARGTYLFIDSCDGRENPVFGGFFSSSILRNLTSVYHSCLLNANRLGVPVYDIVSIINVTRFRVFFYLGLLCRNFFVHHL